MIFTLFTAATMIELEPGTCITDLDLKNKTGDGSLLIVNCDDCSVRAFFFVHM